MGILSALRTRQRFDEVNAAVGGVTDPSTYPIASPWSSSSNLQRIVFEDLFGQDIPVNTRTAAMRLPTIARARNLLCGTTGRLPLRQLQEQTPTSIQPAWLTRTADGSSPQLRHVWTVDDLIFYGWSCWWRDNDGDEIAACSRLNQDEWHINDDGRVEVNGIEAKPNDVIVIPGLHEGLLTYGVDVIDDTRTLYRNVRARLANPVPATDLHQTGGDPLTDAEIDSLITRWATARQGKNGGVGYTSENIEVNELGGSVDAQLMIEARNAAAVDLARAIGVHAGMVDATAPKASLNYETTSGRNQEFVDLDLALYMAPIAWRLSEDDVTPPGTRIDWDLTNFTAPTPSPTGPALED